MLEAWGCWQALLCMPLLAQRTAGLGRPSSFLGRNGAPSQRACSLLVQSSGGAHLALGCRPGLDLLPALPACLGRPDGRGRRRGRLTAGGGCS